MIRIDGNSRSFKLHIYPMNDKNSHWFVVSLADETEQIEYQKNPSGCLAVCSECQPIQDAVPLSYVP